MKRFYYFLVVLLLSGFSIKAQVIQSKNEIKNHFQNGYAPGAVHFGYLIDACYNYSIGKGLLYNSANNLLEAEVPLELLTNSLDNTEQMLRNERDTQLNVLNQQLIENNNNLNNQILNLDTKLSNRITDIEKAGKENFDFKISQLQIALQDTAQILRSSILKINADLQIQIKQGDYVIKELLNQAESTLRIKIDSLANAHNIDRIAQEGIMSQIGNNQQSLRDTVQKLKIKLDTLNFTEENFTQTLKLKLDNIDDGATRSDNNFTDELKIKLDGIENNANDYLLPLATHNQLGGIQLSSQFVLSSGKLYTTLNPNNIDRQFAKDTTLGVWNNLMQKDDVWTRVRYKVENGSVDGEGNKLYDYGEWNQPYKFIYDDLETSYYEFNATDSVNVILGIHERDKFFNGKDNTLLGHNAGYTLYKGGERNVIIGKNSGRSSENISDNVLIGNQAGESIGDPSKSASMIGEYPAERNVAIGIKAMQARNATGKSVALGYSAMEFAEQNSSIAIGYQSGLRNNGSNNISIGYEAANSVDGSKNVSNISIGYRAGYKSTYANRNIFIGDSVALKNESGHENLIIGHGSGILNTGNGNLFLGNDINLAGNNQLAIGNQGKVLIVGDFVTQTVSVNKFSANELSIQKSKSDSYSIGTKEVINSNSQYVGEGGINTLGQIKTGFTNTKTSVDKAITAENGSVAAKYIQANEAILIGNADVVNSSKTFIGTGGVNTLGDISGNNIKANKNLQVAGIDIISTSGGSSIERYAVKNHSHTSNEIITNSDKCFVSDAEKTNWNSKADKSELSSNDYTNAEKSKLAGIQAGANNYTHPATHSADMITTTTSKQFVSQTEKDNWTAGQIPVGGIIMWNGTTVPDGWALCNGQTVNGKVTPDLRGRFIVGSYAGKSGFTPGNSGGSVTAAGKTSTSGSHNHSGNTGGYKLTSSDLPAHTHGMAHTHKISAKKGVRYSSTGDESNAGGSGKGYRRTMQETRDDNFSTEASSRSSTETAGHYSSTINAHKHTIASDGSHTHTVPYYVLAFIMRVE